MAVWGSGGDVLDLGVLETKQCEVCERERPFNIILQYRYWGLCWVFNLITSKKYMLLCEVCQRGWDLDTVQVEKALESVPIPLMRRFGILAGLGGLGTIIVLVALI